MDSNNLGRHFCAWCDRAGIGPVHLHDLRDTCASLRPAQHIHPRVVMEMLGHSGIAITMDAFTYDDGDPGSDGHLPLTRRAHGAPMARP